MPVKVFRNDAVTVAEVAALAPMGIVISPGPGRPVESGISAALIRHFAGRVPILGICLGHQLLAELYGGKIVEAAYPMHGKTSPILHDGKGIFKGLPVPLSVMRYHSLVVEPTALPVSFEVSARTEAGEIMGIRHKFYNLVGLQFHPESILSEGGAQLVQNWWQTLSKLSLVSSPPVGS